MIHKQIVTKYCVQVTVDETKFTEEFLTEFRSYMYRFNTIDDHIEYLGQGYARGMWDQFSFIEGYGQASDFGINFEDIWMEVE